MIELIGWLAAAVAAITGLAMLQDTPLIPADDSRRGWFRHLLRFLFLVTIVATAGVLCLVPEARTATGYEVALRVALAGYMAMQAPCPWWKYIVRGPRPGDTFVDRRRGQKT